MADRLWQTAAARSLAPFQENMLSGEAGFPSWVPSSLHTARLQKPFWKPQTCRSFPPATHAQSTSYAPGKQGEPSGVSAKSEVLRERELKDYCTWGIGGPADFLVEVSHEQSLQETLRWCLENDIRYIVVGKGSNCLFDSAGFRGCVILNRICHRDHLGDGRVRVGSGYPFNQLGVDCSRDGYSGLEFASGIPGTVGGAVFMNAGAGGQETRDCLESVDVLSVESGGIFPRTYSASELEFSYRKSSFQEDGPFSHCMITGATFQLTPSEDARAVQQSYMNKRRKTQPLQTKNAGSVFRNPPEGLPAGALIDRAGLKGLSVGDARVSHVHANFLVNEGSCSSTDMLALIERVREEVRHTHGTILEAEVRYVSPEGHVPWNSGKPVDQVERR